MEEEPLMKTVVLAALALATSAQIAAATDLEAAARAYMEQAAASWASDPLLIEAIRLQNTRTAGLSEAEITVMDAAWQAEIGSASMPTIDGVLSNTASDFLRARLDEAGGIVSEAFVMDSVGLNVATTGITSDYWQGDEAKWQQTYLMGPGAMHLGELELDESTQAFQIQISMPIVDPASSEPIGAITIGLNAEAL
jgi:hypothetical protein